MVSVDTVYQTVLAILNKENRGYMTPQEFNLLANQAQSEIFEQYFYDLNQYNRRGEINNEFANIVQNIKEKIDLFKIQEFDLIYFNGSYELPANLYRLGSVQYGYTEIEQVNSKEFLYVLNSPLTAPSESFPVYIRVDNTIQVYPASIIQEVTCNYIKTPTTVNWTYKTVNGTALYNPSSTDHNDFELHPSEEVTLVNKILTLAGVIIKQPDITQIGEAKDNKKITQEKS
jgi:hypothetical protein